MDNDLRVLIDTRVEMYFPEKRLIVATTRPVVDISNYTENTGSVNWPDEWESSQIVLLDKINGIYELFC